MPKYTGLDPIIYRKLDFCIQRTYEINLFWMNPISVDMDESKNIVQIEFGNDHITTEKVFRSSDITFSSTLVSACRISFVFTVSRTLV